MQSGHNEVSDSRTLSSTTADRSRPDLSRPGSSSRGWSTRDQPIADWSSAALPAARQTRPLDPAWPWDWENRPEKDCCDHLWEVLVVDRLFNPTEQVARCRGCHTPRCGYAEDPDPCIRRRHHDGDHLLESRALTRGVTHSA